MPARSPPFELRPPDVYKRQFESYALVIGISSYPNFPKEQRLKWADADAQDFAEFLTRPVGGGFRSENITLLKNAGATREAIFRSINLLGRRVTSDDQFYLFFAGHSIRDDLERAYFMPVDASVMLPSALGIRPDELLLEVRQRITAKTIAIFIDACQSASVYENGTPRDGSEGVTKELIDAWQRLHKAAPSGEVGFFSATSVQRSWEDDDLKHGVFTYFLLKGLAGAADQAPYGNNDNIVTSGELNRYLVATVSDYTKNKFAEQTPIVSPDFSTEIPLSLMAYQKDRSTSGDVGDKSKIKVTICPTLNSELLKDPHIDALKKAISDAGYSAGGTGYVVPAPNGATAMRALCDGSLGSCGISGRISRRRRETSFALWAALSPTPSLDSMTPIVGRRPEHTSGTGRR